MTIVINKKTYEAGELVAYVEKLEKENTKLKKKLKEKLKTIADKDLSFMAKFDALEKENAGQEEQLIKAKEIIRTLARIVREATTCDLITDTAEILHQATLFLKG